MTIVPEDLSISNYEEHYFSSPVFLCNYDDGLSLFAVKDDIHLKEYYNPDKWNSVCPSLNDN